MRTTNWPVKQDCFRSLRLAHHEARMRESRGIANISRSTSPHAARDPLHSSSCPLVLSASSEPNIGEVGECIRCQEAAPLCFRRIRAISDYSFDLRISSLTLRCCVSTGPAHKILGCLSSPAMCTLHRICCMFIALARVTAKPMANNCKAWMTI